MSDNGGRKVEHKQIITIGIDKTEEQILAFNADPGIEMHWDAGDFKKLSDTAVKQLRDDNKKRYWLAEARAEEAQKAVKGIEIIANPLGNTSDMYIARMKVRPRRGWHTYWAAPGPDYDRCMSSGSYRPIREPTEEQKKKGFEPGEENGEIKKIMNADGKVELIALECREEDYKQYLKWMDQQSSLRYGAIEANYYAATEEINRQIKTKGARIIAGRSDEEGNYKPYD